MRIRLLQYPDILRLSAAVVVILALAVGAGAGARKVLAQNGVPDTASDYLYALYDAFFGVLRGDAEPAPIGPRLRTALIAVGIDRDVVATVRVGYSEYLDRASGGATAMTDCFDIYFPRKELVEAITGDGDVREPRWLLHEIGHSAQCLESGRRDFAVRWFREVGGTVIARISAGLPANPGALHDAMPLERDAREFAERHLEAFEAATKAAAR